jgi:hypothetical protein
MIILDDVIQEPLDLAYGRYTEKQPRESLECCKKNTVGSSDYELDYRPSFLYCSKEHECTLSIPWDVMGDWV